MAEAGLYRWTHGRGVGLRGARGGSWKYRWMASRVDSPAHASPCCSAASTTLSEVPSWRSVNAEMGLGGAHTV